MAWISRLFFNSLLILSQRERKFVQRRLNPLSLWERAGVRVLQPAHRYFRSRSTPSSSRGSDAA